jgi:putative membrane protein
MYVKRQYGLGMLVKWTKFAIIYAVVYVSILTNIYYFLKKEFHISFFLPWEPVGVLGIAVAFYLGFKNNASYDRTWEARKIWGSITNNSRVFASQLVTFVHGENKNEIIEEIVNRHIAWLTALRFQLRLEKEWEHTKERLNHMFTPTVCPIYLAQLDDAIMDNIADDEFELYKGKSNIAIQILAKQSARIQELKELNNIENFRDLALLDTIKTFYTDQGQSERIKNFPFPRQYASIAFWLTIVFSAVIPFGMLDVFSSISKYHVWLTIPVASSLIWIFYLMEIIGDYSENPFEGTYNDVPITAIARNIEIDMLEIIGATNIPEPIVASNGVLM